MFNISDLTDQQIEQIKTWAENGDQLADIQKKINSEFQPSTAITYLDTRFAILDLGIELIVEKNQEEEEEKDQPTPLTPIGYVDATVDEIMRPSFLASGKVTFSDGTNALWGIDQMGRLKVDADDPNYTIDDEDMIAFQEILRDKLKK